MPTVSGIWKWNDRLKSSSPAGSVTTTANAGTLYYTSGNATGNGGVNVSDISVYRGASSGYNVELTYFGNIGGVSPLNVVAYSDTGTEMGGTWTDESYKTINFGDTEQEVNSDFYEWFIQNATKQEEPAVPKVSGVWKWNDTLPFSDDYTGSSGLGDTVNFTSNSNSYTSIFIHDSQYDPKGQRVLVYDTLTIAYSATSGWTNEAYKTIDFGSEEQEVSEDFYTYLTANATQQEEPTTQKVSGTWTWNDAPNVSTSINQAVNFTSNSSNFNEINTAASRLNYTYTDGGSTETVYRNNTWSNDAYKTVNFGSTEQEVSEEFYNYLTQNAVQDGGDEPVPTTTKTVSSDNLARFKQKCDETYAKIGDAGNDGTDGQPYAIINANTVVTTEPAPDALITIPGSNFYPTLNGSDGGKRVAGVVEYNGQQYYVTGVCLMYVGTTMSVTLSQAVNITGATGADGTDGKDALYYKTIASATVEPVVFGSVNLVTASFNRTPEVGEAIAPFCIQWGESLAEGTVTHSFLCSATVASFSGTNTIVSLTGVVETTGAQGSAGEGSGSEVVDLGTLQLGGNTISGDIYQAAIKDSCIAAKATIMSIPMYIPKYTSIGSMAIFALSSNQDGALNTITIQVESTNASVDMQNLTIPTPSAADNGKVLGVTNGEYALQEASGGGGKYLHTVCLTSADSSVKIYYTLINSFSQPDSNIVGAVSSVLEKIDGYNNPETYIYPATGFESNGQTVYGISGSYDSSDVEVNLIVYIVGSNAVAHNNLSRGWTVTDIVTAL